MEMNKWLNHIELTLEEIRIGNFFIQSPLCTRCFVTDIDSSGTIQYVDYFTEDTYANETIDSLRPWQLPDGGNVMELTYFLKDTGFIFSNEYLANHYQLNIELKKCPIGNGWTLAKNNVIKRVYYFHELQNAFQDLNNQKLL